MKTKLYVTTFQSNYIPDKYEYKLFKIIGDYFMIGWKTTDGKYGKCIEIPYELLSALQDQISHLQEGIKE